nr:hypothetical protein BaRGS_010721 [Batillaria attramentaria]
MATEATFDTEPFQLHKLEAGPSNSVSVTRDEALKYYTSMQTIRRMETAAANLYKTRTGKGGSMHMYGKNFYGGNGIVGAQVPLGAGIAFAMKYEGKQNVCVALFGDGASNQGQVYEAYNMSKLWDLPVIYVCENNGYGMGTSAHRSSASVDYFTRADYIPGIWVDAMDVLAVKSATEFSRKFALENGPILLEAATYRYYGHSMSDPGISYRSREEVQEVRETRDPITSFRDRLVTSELATADELKAIDNDVKKEVNEAAEKAKTDPELPLSELYTHIYHQPEPDMKVRGCDITVVGTMG